MQKEEFEKLLNRYKAGNTTARERALIESWYLRYEPNNAKPSHQQLDEDQQNSIANLLNQIDRKSYKLPLLWLAAATITIFFSVGLYFFKYQPARQHQVLSKVNKHDAAPGGNKATLTLANGATILLNGTATGKLATQGNIIVIKTADGKISYRHANNNGQQQALTYNIATTPRGGQYQFVLSDGTSVWLNSASSIKYPVEFTGNERKVELTGEAYFEVAHNDKKPFRVASNGQTVEVLGTHFNINSYTDEGATKTTLLQGSVKIISANDNSTIKPGEQAQLIGGKLSVTNVDVEEAVAWKNGFFYFKDNNIQTIMRQLSRWYDVDVKFEGHIPERELSGEISRSVNASQILDILTFKKIHYRIDGKDIIITP